MSTEYICHNTTFFMKGGNILETETFGIKIKTARLEKGLTQQDLSKIIGVTPESISYYEAGKKTPSFDKIKTICRVLNLDINEM